VDDAAVVPGLVPADRGLALEHREPQSRPAREQLARRGQADDAGSDDDDVEVGAGNRRPPV
jgi:hypothetical protein